MRVKRLTVIHRHIKAPCKTLAGGFLRPCQIRASLTFRLICPTEFCEIQNNFDEFKNQWGWSGFTTRKLKSCRTMARLIAIVANWWNVFNGKTLVMESFGL